MMNRQIVSITEFKAKCLAMLNEIGENGGEITITKRGRPLATVRPARKQAWKSPEGMWTGKIEYDDDLFASEKEKIWQAWREEPGEVD